MRGRAGQGDAGSARADPAPASAFATATADAAAAARRVAHDPYRDDGDAWLASRRHVAYRVPSAVATTECNVLLDPSHPRFAALEPVDRIRTRVDPRLRRDRRA